MDDDIHFLFQIIIPSEDLEVHEMVSQSIEPKKINKVIVFKY